MIDQKLIPRGQTLWESVWSKDGTLKYFITSDAMRTKYTRYDMVNGVVEKGPSAKTPISLHAGKK